MGIFGFYWVFDDNVTLTSNSYTPSHITKFSFVNKFTRGRNNCLTLHKFLISLNVCSKFAYFWHYLFFLSNKKTWYVDKTLIHMIIIYSRSQVMFWKYNIIIIITNFVSLLFYEEPLLISLFYLITLALHNLSTSSLRQISIFNGCYFSYPNRSYSPSFFLILSLIHRWSKS